MMTNSTKKVWVAGDFMLDHYYWGKCDRISPEAPVPVVEIQKESWTLGGAGNVVKNLLALGVEVEVSGVLGADPEGERLKGILAEKGVGISGLMEVETRPTTVKSRIIAGHQQVIRFDHETRASISEELIQSQVARLQETLAGVDAVILSDYGKGFLHPDLISSIVREARALDKPVFVDPKGRDYSRYRAATLLTPNRKEAEEATGISLVDEESIEQAAEWLRTTLELDYLVITLSEDGMALYDGGLTIVPTTAKEVYDVTGAGDTSLAAFVYAWLSGKDLVGCAHFANAAAAVVIAKLGSETATLAEIDDYLG